MDTKKEHNQSKKTKQILREKNLGKKNPVFKVPPKRLILDENLGYILGTIMGDGSIIWDIKNGVYQIRLNVIDKDFALTFKKSLEEWSGFEVKVYFYQYHYMKNKQYVVILCSKFVVNYLKNFDINKIKVSSKKIKTMFLKGMYDSEGCVPGKSKYISISQNGIHLLQLCKDLLLDLDIESTKIRLFSKRGTPYKTTYNDGRTDYGTSNFDHYEFNIGRKESLIKFRDLVRFSIKRKQDKLVNMIKLYCTKEEIKFISSLSPNKKKNWKKLYN